MAAKAAALAPSGGSSGNSSGGSAASTPCPPCIVNELSKRTLMTITIVLGTLSLMASVLVTLMDVYNTPEMWETNATKRKVIGWSSMILSVLTTVFGGLTFAHECGAKSSA